MKNQPPKKPSMADWLNLYPPKRTTKAQDNPVEDRNRKINHLPIDSTIDLHGSTLNEAQTELDFFIKQALQKGHEKILVIHGKGKHSKGGKAVLKEGLVDYLLHHPNVRKTGKAGFSEGGVGATWAVLKY